MKICGRSVLCVVPQDLHVVKKKKDSRFALVGRGSERASCSSFVFDDYDDSDPVQ